MGTKNRPLPLLLLMTALMAPAARAESSELPTAQEILSKVDARMGDPAKRKKLRTLAMRGTVEWPDCGAPGARSKGKFEEFWLAPDRVHSRVEWGKSFYDTGTTGAFAWSHDSMLGIVIREGDEQGPARRMFDLQRRASWRDLYQSAETIGVEPLPDLANRDHYKLAMKPASGATETWYVDAETFDVGCVETTIPDFVGDTMAGRYFFSDYREVDGMRFPFTKVLKLGADPTPFPQLCDSIEVNGAVKPDQVAPPADVLAAVKDPSKRLQPPGKDATECKIEEITAQPALSIRVTVPAGDVSTTLATLFPEMLGVIAEVGGTMAGPPYTRYHSEDDKTVDLEAGIPLREKVEGKGRVKATELPGGKTVVTWHVGPYDALPQAHARIRSWLASQSIEARGGIWEVYWTDPGIEPDPAKWRTRLYCPVK